MKYIISRMPMPRSKKSATEKKSNASAKVELESDPDSEPNYSEPEVDDDDLSQSAGEDEDENEGEDEAEAEDELDDAQETAAEDEEGDVDNEKNEDEEEGEEGEDGEEDAPEIGNDEEGVADAASIRQCHLKNLNKEFTIIDDDDPGHYAKIVPRRIPDDKRMTTPIMTIYEMVRILGTRARQFELRAPPLIKGVEGLPPLQMAFLELIAHKTPFVVKRFLPGKLEEHWKVSELKIIHRIRDPFFVPANYDDAALARFIEQAQNPSNNKD